MLPDVHLEATVVTGLVPTHVIEKVLEALEGTSTVPTAPQLGTHVCKRQGFGGLASRGTERIQFQASGTKEATITMRTLDRRGVSGFLDRKVRAIGLLPAVTPRDRDSDDGESPGSCTLFGVANKLK